MTAHRDVIVEALIELADASYQQRVWAADDPNEMLSFVECIERLFDDSGLAIALSHGSAFGPPVDEQMRALGQLVDSVDAGQPVGQPLQDPAQAECRRLAGAILRGLPELLGPG